MLAPCFEPPRRADLVLAAVRREGLGEVLPPEAFGPEPVLRVHALLVLEGGYAVDAIGLNAVTALKGFGKARACPRKVAPSFRTRTCSNKS